LSPSDLKLQMQYIRASLHWNSVQDPCQPDRVSSSGEGRFLRTALAIAENISHSAIRSDEGEAGWVAQAQEITAHSCQFQPMRRDLYDGTCGVALFLAALQSVAGINKYGELARAALKPVLRVSTDQMRYWVQGDKLGAGLGSPSVIYSLVKISGLLKDESLLDFAFKVASLIDQRQITADGRYDLLGGISGCLVAFRALYQKKKHPWILNTIRTCADHLLAKRMAMPQGHLSWAASDGRFLSGFAHGTSGISFALRQAYAILEDERYLRAANASGEASNGRDGSPPDRSDLSWCHGETGVLFGELETRSVYHSRSEEAVQHGKLEQIASRPLDLLDFPCCGNMGRVDLLLEAGRRLSQPKFHDQASSLADRILTRVNHHARWGLGSRDSFHSPSFHQGMAGIGYTLLRLEQPNLPAILCWE
jgi:lantibiotic modifying enzyme